MILSRHHILLRLSVLFFLALIMASCVQTKSLVKKSYAFYFENVREAFPKGGNDEISDTNINTSAMSGNKNSLRGSPVVDTFIVVYLETTKRQIHWDTAWQNEQPYLITPLPIKQLPFHAGIIKNGSEVIISPAEGILLWQLQFQRIGTNLNLKSGITAEEIIIKGNYKGKKVSWNCGLLKAIIPVPPA